MDRKDIDLRIQQLNYAIAKQLDVSGFRIETNYGEIPLDPFDVMAVTAFLRNRFEERIVSLQGSPQPDDIGWQCLCGEWNESWETFCFSCRRELGVDDEN